MARPAGGAGITLIFAVLRKELAPQLLAQFAVAVYGSAAADLRPFMTGDTGVASRRWW